MRVSVVIPTYNHWGLTNQILTDLFNNCYKDIDELIVINNGSRDEDVKIGMQYWEASHNLPITEYVIPDNVGFLKAANEGMKVASGDILILISNDVRVSDSSLIPTIKTKLSEKRCILGGKLFTGSTGWNDFGGRVFPYLEGWLLACYKWDWEDLGVFDERYCPSDFEDVDASTTAIARGFSLVALDNVRVTHIGGATIGYNPERQAITERNREKFKEKWMK